MASIKTAIKLTDGVTSTANRITSSLNRTSSAYSKLAKDSKNAGISQGGFASGVSKIGGIAKRVTAIATAYVGVKKAIDLAKSSLESYNDKLVKQTKLNTVMSQRMGVDAEKSGVNALISNETNKGIVGGKAQMEGAQMAATFLHSTKALRNLIPAMNDLAVQQYGVNVTSEGMVNIGKMVGKVMQGQTSALKRAGVTFTEAEEKAIKYGNEAQRAAELAKVITNNVGNMNEAIANTPAGKLKQLENRWGAIKTKIGEGLAPALEKVIDYVDKNWNTIVNMFSYIGGGITSVATGIVSLMQGFIDTGTAGKDAGETIESAMTKAGLRMSAMGASGSYYGTLLSNSFKIVATNIEMAFNFSLKRVEMGYNRFAAKFVGYSLGIAKKIVAIINMVLVAFNSAFGTKFAFGVDFTEQDKLADQYRKKAAKLEVGSRLDLIKGMVKSSNYADEIVKADKKRKEAWRNLETFKAKTSDNKKIKDYSKIDTALAKSSKKTADNTAKMADSLNVTAEDIKYIRDIASQRSISRYTNTNLNLNMTNNNNIASDIDVDGMINHMTSRIQQEMSAGAEGVV